MGAPRRRPRRLRETQSAGSVRLPIDGILAAHTIDLTFVPLVFTQTA